MSYTELRDLLGRIFPRINAANSVPDPQDIWTDFSDDITALSAEQDLADQFTRLRSDVQAPKAVEAARVLSLLRQRLGPDKDGKPLVGRIRAEVVSKQRPTRDRTRASLTGRDALVARLAPSFPAFSSFQVEGWGKVVDAIKRRESLVVVAPTGAGKSEVFLMPIIEGVARSIQRETSTVPRFVLLYPRVALLKDQLSRIFRYVWHAEQQYLASGGSMFGSKPVNNGIVIGFQFDGIRADAKDTLKVRENFGADRTFRVVEQCPICSQGTLKAAPRSRNGITLIRCDNQPCGAEFRTSISKNDHAAARPHLLVTTAESLDLLYLNPKAEFERYLTTITGVVMDEAHLYHSLYGVHIHHLLRRLEELPRPDGKPLARIAASATIPSPERFVAKLFHGDETVPVEVHDATAYDQDPAGLEVLYFLQSPEEENRPGAAPTLIQSVMAMGHGILCDGDRVLVFVDSRDMAGRLEAQIRDAETRLRLWEFRVDLPLITFGDRTSPQTNPVECPLYLEGECWRGILGGERCHEPIGSLKAVPLNITQVSSVRRGSFSDADVVVTTPSLEVGVDDPSIKSTIHYLPPRTVYSFIQRRGRAGRQSGEVAYTLMVLGNTPADHFYFFRRNRLVAGRYELPLNPHNPVIRQMHERLQEERDRIGTLIRRYGYQDGVWRWVWDKLNGCGLLQEYYSQELADRATASYSEQKAFVQSWLRGEKARLENYLSLRYTLREIESESPGELHDVAQAALDAADAFLAGGTVSAAEVGERLESLYTELGRIRFREMGQRTHQLQATEEKVKRVWNALSLQEAWGIEPPQAERLYDFLRTLEKLYEHESVLRYAPMTLKIMLQSMFYLHVGLEDTEEPGNCTSRIDYFIPDAYFNVVRPVVVEVRYPADSPRLTELRQEDVTTLSTLLIPYKPVYRYHGQSLSLLDTAHDLADVSEDGSVVRVGLLAEGVRRQGALEVQKVHVRPLRGDPQGQQIVQMCPECYALYDVFRQRPCHGDRLQLVKLYAQPIVERKYLYQDGARLQITRTLHSLESVEGITTVLGSDVQAFVAVRSDGDFRRTGNPFREFQARYKTDVRYRLATKGLSWDLSEIVDCVLQDEDLQRPEIAQVFARTGKTLNAKLVLHTAAHLLNKAVAAISGVNEQMLEYWYDPDRREVVVWERYEGGAGISDIFVETLRTNPAEVYQELLASVLCPVDLSERDTWTSSGDLRDTLADAWGLSPENEFLGSLVGDAEGERQADTEHEGEETRLTCRQNDGCPACVYTTYCTDREHQTGAVSRVVGEAIMRCLLRRVDRTEMEHLMGAAADQDVAPPAMLNADPVRGTYDVLLL